MQFEDKLATGIDGIIQCLAWPNSTKDVVMIGTTKGTLKLIDLKKNKIIWKEENLGGLILDLDFNSNGVLAMAGAFRSFQMRFFEGKMLDKQVALATESYSRCVQFSPTGIFVAVGFYSGAVIVYDVTTHKPFTRMNPT